MPQINFFSEEINFSLPKPRKTATWIKDVIAHESHLLKLLNFIFCSDEYLMKINRQYLRHDTYTDIVTFDNSEPTGGLEGDIFISVDRVKENAMNLHAPFYQELHRVIIHGVLHLMGYSDKTKAKQKEMRNKEDACLSLPSVPRETFT